MWTWDILVMVFIVYTAVMGQWRKGVGSALSVLEVRHEGSVEHSVCARLSSVADQIASNRAGAAATASLPCCHVRCTK